LHYFFGDETIKFNYGHRPQLFGQSILGFRKMDKINVQNRIYQNTLPKNIQKSVLHFFLTFSITLENTYIMYGGPALSTLKIYYFICGI